MVMSLLETGRHSLTVYTMSLLTRNPTPCSCLSSFPLKKKLCPSSVVVVLPKFFHLISQSPRMFHLYLSILCVSSWSFPVALSALVFHVRCLFHESLMMHQKHTLHRRPGVQRKARSLLTRAATDPVWYGCLFSSHGEPRAKYNLTETSLSKSNTWLLSSSWNPSAHQALFFEL